MSVEFLSAPFGASRAADGRAAAAAPRRGARRHGAARLLRARVGRDRRLPRRRDHASRASPRPTGIIILALIYALGHVSGAHFNPGVTLAFALFRHFQPRDVLPYWRRSSWAAIAGAALLWALFGDVAELRRHLPSGTDAQTFGWRSC